MSSALHILSEPDLVRSLANSWPTVSAALRSTCRDNDRRYEIALTSLQRARATSALGGGSAADLWRTSPPTLSAPDRSALFALVDHPFDLGSRRLLLERFAGLGLISGTPSDSVLNAQAIVAAGRALAHPDIRWLDAALGEEHTTEAWFGLMTWADTVEVTDGSLLPTTCPVRLRERWLSRQRLATDEEVAAVASILRASLWRALDDERPTPHDLRDADPDAPDGWRGAMPGLLFDDQRLTRCLSCVAGATHAEHIVAGVATLSAAERERWLVHAPGGNAEHLLWWAEPHASLSSHDALRTMQQRWRIADRDVAAAIRDADGATEGAASWRDIVALSAADSLPSAVDDALSETTDWLSFDSPGEGALPQIWRDALRLHPAWGASWAARFEALLHEQAPSVAETLDAYPSPYSAATSRLNSEQSPLSSYTHGLNDAIEEAYGDVFSPADPFSQR